jgi:hypothetical protein
MCTKREGETRNKEKERFYEKIKKKRGKKEGQGKEKRFVVIFLRLPFMV